MTFIGQLGTPGSTLGKIILGLWYLSGPTDFTANVHVLEARKIRVYFNDRLSESSAIDTSAYTLTSLAPPGTALTPTISEVIFFDEAERAVILILDNALTSGTDYTIELNGILSIHGKLAPPGPMTFTANVIDYPIAIGAWQSKRDAVDILFDRDVGSYSAAATFEIRDASLPGPGVAMAQLAWAGENIPETTLRVTLPAGMPAADAYEIDFSGVTDISFNNRDGTVPLTLALRASTPYSYAELRQIQITDAYVVDVNNYGAGIGTIRVYFNGPVIDATVTGNWAAWQSAVHLKTDPSSEITSPDPFILAQLIVMVNEWKADFNAHLTRNGVHSQNDTINMVTAPDAFDLNSCYVLINDEQEKYLAHLQAWNVHLYDDYINVFNYLDVTGNFALALAVARQNLKVYFNDHVLLDEYPLSFTTVSSGYPSPTSTITQFCRYSNEVYETRGAYTLFCDLHFEMESNAPSVRLEATVTSEDGFSVTNPANYTGSITARARKEPAQALSSLVVPEESISITFDRQLSLSGAESLKLFDSSGSFTPSRFRVTMSLPAALWALNNTMYGYNRHLPASPVHRVTDTVNSIGISDYAQLPLSFFIDKANAFKEKLTRHMTSAVYHDHSDYDIVTAPDATDEVSLIRLVTDVQHVVIDHLKREGVHRVPAVRRVSAPINDMLVIESELMVDGEEYEINGIIRDVYHDNYLGDSIDVSPVWVNWRPGTYFYNYNDFSFDFTGLAMPPSLASAIPRPGLVHTDLGLLLQTDTVEVFFSKPMHQLSADSSNLPVSGGSISQNAIFWMNPNRISIQVQKMEQIGYTVTANGMTDIAGNLVF
jgi:hypothetical protein